MGRMPMGASAVGSTHVHVLPGRGQAQEGSDIGDTMPDQAAEVGAAGGVRVIRLSLDTLQAVVHALLTDGVATSEAIENTPVSGARLHESMPDCPPHPFDYSYSYSYYYYYYYYY